MMIAAIICAASLAMMLLFFVSYCRSLIAAHSDVRLSDQVREIAGIEGARPEGDAFPRLAQLAELCPRQQDNRAEVTAVDGYYRLLGLLRAMARPAMPRILAWAERERESCAYYIAVVLSRRIEYSRDLLAQQIAEGR